MQEDELASLLVAFDAALRNGTSSVDLATFTEGELSPNDLAEFRQARQCVELLHELFPAIDSTSTISMEGTLGQEDSEFILTHDEVTLPSRFELIRHIGSGAMGTVFEVVDKKRERHCALKTLRRVEPSEILRFKQEFRFLSEVVHENLVVLEELFQHGTSWHFTMELVDGVDLLSAVHAQRTTDQQSMDRLLCRLLRQIVLGIGELHHQGLLHRDIKPSNILVTHGNKVVVIDFGLALRFQTDRERYMEFAGTTAYMSPEQAACRELSAKSDWYSLGVILFQLISGKFPFEGTTQLMAKQLRDAPLLSEVTTNVNPRWDTLCQALLSRAPDQRPDRDELLSWIDQIENSNLATEPTRYLSDVARPLPSGSLFVGREEPLAQLHFAGVAASEGTPVIVTISGESGIGKSSLVEHFLETLQAHGSSIVLRGRCHERESVSFKSLDSVVDSLCRHLRSLPAEQVETYLPADIALLSQMFPVLNTVSAIAGRVLDDGAIEEGDQLSLRQRAWSALRRLLINLGQDHRLIIFIDDMQWGDEAGAAALSQLLYDAQGSILLILTYRFEHACGNPCLDALRLDKLRNLERTTQPIQYRSRFQRVHIELNPMTHEESQQLVLELREEQGRLMERRHQDRLREWDPELIATESGGLPFFIHELINSNDHRLTNCEADSDASPVHTRLDEVIWTRMQQLPAQARSLVETVAVAGHPVSLDIACTVARTGRIESRLFAQLQATRILRTVGADWQDLVTTFHDRIRTTIVTHLSAAQRREIHLSLATSLELEESVDPETVARHYDAAGNQARAIEWFEVAAEAAEKVLDFERAIELYSRLLQLSSMTNRLSNLTKLGQAYAHAGRGSEAATKFEEAARLSNEEQAYHLKRLAAQQYCISGFSDQGRTLLHDVLQESGIRLHNTPMSILTSLTLQRARLWLRGRKYQRRQEAEISPTHLRTIDSLLEAASGLGVQEPFVMASLHTRGLIEALKAGEPKRLIRALSWEAVLSATSGTKSIPLVNQLLAEARQLTPHAEDRISRGMLLLGEGGTAFLMVRMPEAFTHLSAAEGCFFDETPKAWWELATTRALLCWSLMHMGDFVELRQRLKNYERDAESRGDHFLLSSIHGAGLPQTLLAEGQPEEAQSLLDQLVRRNPYERFQQQHVSILFSQANIDFYRGQGGRAWERFNKIWPLLRRSMQLHNQFARVYLLDLRARSAILADEQKKDPRMLRAARQDLKRIQREPGPWVQPFADRLSAVLNQHVGNAEAAISDLERASRGFVEIGFALPAAITNRRLGRIIQGEQGKELVANADQELGKRGIQDYEAIERVYLI